MVDKRNATITLYQSVIDICATEIRFPKIGFVIRGRKLSFVFRKCLQQHVSCPDLLEGVIPEGSVFHFRPGRVTAYGFSGKAALLLISRTAVVEQASGRMVVFEILDRKSAVHPRHIGGHSFLAAENLVLTDYIHRRNVHIGT